MKSKLKVNDVIIYKGHSCIVWGINGIKEVVLFNTASRNYITVPFNQVA